MRNAMWFVMLVVGLAFAAPAVGGQGAAVAPASVQTGCCGPVTAAGESLRQMLNSLDVEHHWLAARHVEWKSGQPKGDVILDGKAHTHCSAFAAAVGERLGIYMLRPPEHGLMFLASAQGEWFTSNKAGDRGWVKVPSASEAQRRANHGELVVLDYISPNPERPGHIAIVRPAVKSAAALEAEGPETIQAGKTNFSDGNAAQSFHSHRGAWPQHVLIYAHATKMSAAEAGGVVVDSR